MRKIVQRLHTILWLLSFQLLVLHSAGFDKTGYDSYGMYTAERTAVLITYTCDTVPVSDTFDFYVSNQGFNSNSGTASSTPKLTLDSITGLVNSFATSNNQVSLGLEANSLFREEFDVFKDQLNVGSFNLQPGKKAAKITGMNVVENWSALQGTRNVYAYAMNHSIGLTDPNYSYVFVAEIDTMMEKLYPVSAVKYLTFVSDADHCEASTGSFYVAPLTRNPITVYIHSTEGVPGKNKYRYEVVKRPYAINSFYYNNCTFENLFLQSSGNGYGMLSAGENTYVNRVTFQGGGTHHAVIKNGTVDHSLFLPGPKGLADEIGLVFYKPGGLGNINKISNTIFLDVKTPVFTHTDGISNYRLLTIDSTYAFADTLNTYIMLSSNNTDSVVISNSYCNGYKNFWVGMPSSLVIKNSVINKVSEPAIYIGSKNETACNATVTNTLIVTNSNDFNQLVPPVFQSSIGFLFAQDNTSLKVTNSTFYGRSTWHTQKPAETVFENSIKNNKLEALNNVYICDVNTENYFHVVNANNSTGIGTASNIISDYNVYILLRGTIYWTAYPNSPQGDGNIFSLADWQSYTGQDKHSIFIDLRNNPAGLKAIFTDPESGNWTLAQTPLADSVRKLNAGLLAPPLYYPLRPTYEDALDHTLPGGLSYFTGSKDLNRQVVLNWKTIREPNLAYFGVESSRDKMNFINTGSVETTGRYKDNEYNFTRPDTSSVRIYYRLRLMNSDSSYTYSPTIFIDPSKKDSIISGIGSSAIGIIIHPNPVQTLLTVEHPARNKAEISVYNYAGKKLTSVQVETGALNTSLSMFNLPAGSYIVEWSSGKEKKAIPFLKGK